VDLKASRQQGQAEDRTGHRRHGEPLLRVQVRQTGHHDVVRARGCYGVGGLGVSGEKRRCERDEQEWESPCRASVWVGASVGDRW
jgi:hypothetical protein